MDEVIVAVEPSSVYSGSMSPAAVECSGNRDRFGGEDEENTLVGVPARPTGIRDDMKSYASRWRSKPFAGSTAERLATGFTT